MKKNALRQALDRSPIFAAYRPSPGRERTDLCVKAVVVKPWCRQEVSKEARMRRRFSMQCVVCTVYVCICVCVCVLEPDYSACSVPACTAFAAVPFAFCSLYVGRGSSCDS